MVLPFVLGMSDKLRKLGAAHGLSTWFTYPGRLADKFTKYRGRLHWSKTKDSVYSIPCSCGVQYVGESSRNLKVRIAEHLQYSSKSALTSHLLDNQLHKLVLNHTQILAREPNSRKRKIPETLAITHKRSPLCNTAVSTELSEVWQTCASFVTSQLSKSD